MAMAPPLNSTTAKNTRQQRTSGSQKRTPYKKPPPTQRASTRSTVRLQSKLSASDVQAASTYLAPISQPARTKRKRSPDFGVKADELEGVRPSKQPRKITCLRLEPSEKKLPKDLEARAKANKPKGSSEQPQEPPLLSEKDSQSLQSLYKEVMDYTATNAATLKRTSSRRSMAQSETGSEKTQRSSNTTANYRYKNLKAAEIHIHTIPPKKVRAAIRCILRPKIPKELLPTLRTIARELHEGCRQTVNAGVGEDDFIHLLFAALKAMSLTNLCLREKADWKEELKPIVKRSGVSLSFLESFNAMGSDQQQEIEDTSVLPPPKRQHQSSGLTYISPQSSMDNTMPPPTSRYIPEKAKETLSIKTPRPDISIGPKEPNLISALSSALSPQKFTSTRATRFLEEIQSTKMKIKEGQPEETVLIIVPTQRPSDLVFPFCVVEGKAYSTGKQVFEAQNQAAVSGACGVKMQKRLDKVVELSTGEPLNDEPQLFFSICTEGPHHELWVHYTYVEDNEDKFGQVLWETCNGMLLKSVINFIFSIYKVMYWGAGPFLESVVERLAKVARKGLSH